MVVLHQIDEKLIILLTTTAPKRFHPKNFPSNHPYIPLTLHVLPLTPIILLTLSLSHPISISIFLYLSFMSILPITYPSFLISFYPPTFLSFPIHPSTPYSFSPSLSIILFILLVPCLSSFLLYHLTSLFH